MIDLTILEKEIAIEALYKWRAFLMSVNQLKEEQNDVLKLIETIDNNKPLDKEDIKVINFALVFRKELNKRNQITDKDLDKLVKKVRRKLEKENKCKEEVEEIEV